MSNFKCQNYLSTLRSRPKGISNLKSFAIYIVVLSFTILVLSLGPSSVLAQSRVRSDNYEVQMPGFNSGAGIPSSSNYRLDSTIGQTAPGLYTSTGYLVRAGFQYIHSIIPFTLSISDINVDFGSLLPQTPVTQASTIEISAGGAGGYSVKAYANHPLRDGAGTAEIPDTLCDSGPCTETQAQPWTLTTTYGFGFNMDGDDVPADFVNTNYFRQFSDASIPEAPAIIMGKDQVTYNWPTNVWPWKSEATITYKVNIGPTQPPGFFTNIITYIAIPGY